MKFATVPRTLCTFCEFAAVSDIREGPFLLPRTGRLMHCDNRVLTAH